MLWKNKKMAKEINWVCVKKRWAGAKKDEKIYPKNKNGVKHMRACAKRRDNLLQKVDCQLG